MPTESNCEKSFEIEVFFFTTTGSSKGTVSAVKLFKQAAPPSAGSYSDSSAVKLDRLKRGMQMSPST